MGFEVTSALQGGRVPGRPARNLGAAPAPEAFAPALPRETVQVSAAQPAPEQPGKPGRLARLARTSLVVGGLAALSVAAAPVLAIRAGAELAGKIGSRLLFGGPRDTAVAERPTEFKERYGPWAVVTGASSGIGAEFARELAGRGVNVVMIARRADRLEELAGDLRAKHGVQVKTVSVDLTRPDFMKSVEDATRGLDVGLLVNNAGTWEFGPILEHDLDREMRVLDLNTRVPLAMSHSFGRNMAEKGSGGIVMVSSGAAYQGTAGQTNYAATKAYMLNLAEGLAAEWKPLGVDVLCTTPGPVTTEGAAEVDFSKLPMDPVSARTVAVDALDNLGHKTTTVPGFLTRWSFKLQQAMFSRDLNSTLAGEFFARALGKKDPAQAAAGGAVGAAAAGGAVGAAAAGSAVDLGVAAGATSSGPVALALKLCKPLTSLLATARFARTFLGDLRKRAEEITQTPSRVEDHLLAKGLHQPYQPPVNATTVKLEGKLTIKASMQEFFALWASWIDQGYGSVNDRQYADLVRKHADEAKNLPLLGYVPMSSEDAFTVDIQDGKIQSMTETTLNRFAGLVPTAKVDWAYQRTQEPRVANSFEHAVDQHNGDVQAVEAFYNRLFDPKRLNPDSTAIVKFELREVPSLPAPASKTGEYQHHVSLPAPAPMLVSHPDSTLE